MKKQLLFILMMMLPIVASADDSGTCGENVTWTYTEATKTLTIDGSGAMTHSVGVVYLYGVETIVIGDDVTIIGEKVFKDATRITSVIIGNGVLFIGDSAFQGCSSLASVTIGNSMMSIGNSAFQGCSSLTSITIPNSVTRIGSGAFAGCSSLTSVTIPNSVTDIESSAFGSCSSLVSINIGNSVTSIEDHVFDQCTNLVSVNIPNSVTKIKDWAFADCSSLNSVIIPNSVTRISNNAFQNCSNLSSIIVDTGNTFYDSRENCNAIISTRDNCLMLGCKSTIIPNSVTAIGSSAFANVGITSIVIPNSVTTIYSNAFYRCKDLTAVTLTRGLTRIYNSAFAYCGLTSIVIPQSVNKLDNDVFWECDDLLSIIVEEGNEIYDSRENCNAIIRTEDNSLLIGCKSTVIPNSVTSIGRYAFAGCDGLTAINLPNSITTIDEGAFLNSGLTTINLPSNVSTIGDQAFQSSGLSTIILPENLIIIGSSAFADTNLSSIILPNRLEKIGYAAFAGCKLENIIVKNCNTISSSAFSSAVYQHGILYVPAGQRRDAIYGDGGWSRFNNIREIAMESRELSEAKAYTLMNTNDFSLAVYDAVNGEVANASSLYDIDENNASNAWQIIKGDDDNYLYNIGARQYAGIDADGKIVLSSSPVAISLRETKNGFTLGDNNSQQWGFVINENVKPYKDLSAIDNITSSAIRDAYYTLDGQRLIQAKKGLNIIRTSNGKAKKVIMRSR